jgi:hypothetical protein
MLPHSELLQLKRRNTPTIYNGWEQITKRKPATDAFILEETRDFMPQMGPMVGHAVTQAGTILCFCGGGPKPGFAGSGLTMARFNLLWLEKAE